MGAAPVVLVHGVGMSHRYYARLQKVLARTRDVHAIDLPGFGSFGRPRTDFPPERMARGLAVVLERLIDRCRGRVVDLRLLAADGVDVLMIQVLQSRPELHRWYERHGFTNTQPGDDVRMLLYLREL